MEILAPVAFDEVRADFDRDHPVARDHEANTNQDAVDALALADRTFGGWSKVRLGHDELRTVMLPWHLSEGGGRELVPRSGRTIGQAADLLRAHAAEFAAANPVCQAKLDRFRTGPFTSVYLSTRALPHDDYADLPADTAPYHLDGLHRLLAWELSGRLAKAGGLTVLIAGDLTPLAPTAAGDGASQATTGGQRT
ncbi:DUF6309 family protein [Streptomyces sp. NPDC047315]|uniref:DUF6309 family protein n=1 Tax=Streptomyces sp. NPDC047315 TaxID=3155142 RepID=UPI0033C3D9B1